MTQLLDQTTRALFAEDAGKHLTQLLLTGDQVMSDLAGLTCNAAANPHKYHWKERNAIGDAYTELLKHRQRVLDALIDYHNTLQAAQHFTIDLVHQLKAKEPSSDE